MNPAAGPPPDRPPPPAAPEGETPIRTRFAGLQGYGVVSLAVVIVVAGLSLAQGFFIPVFVSVVVALALARIVRKLERIMPRWVASAGVVLSLVGVLGAGVYTLSDEAAGAIAELPKATRSLREAARVFLNQKQGTLRELRQAVDELERTATESTERPSTPRGVTAVQVVEPPINFSNVVWLGSQGVVWVAAQLTLVLFLVYFLLAYGDLFKRKLIRLSGETLAKRRVTVQLIDDIGDSVAKSISHLTLASTMVGVATTLCLWLLDVHYAGLWGLAAGLFNFIPYVGPLVIACGLFLAGIVQFGDIPMAVLVASVSIAITAVEGFLFTPIVFGRAARVNPVAVFIGFLFWGWLWGLWGMLLALPLLLIMRAIADKVDDLAPLAELLSD
jgi:predicted PurR-regulated permease PerM